MEPGFYLVLCLSFIAIGVVVVAIAIRWGHVPDSEINLLVTQLGLTRIAQADIAVVRSKTFWLFNDLNVGRYRIYADGEGVKLVVLISGWSLPSAIVYCPIDQKHARLRYGKVNDYARPKFAYGETQDKVIMEIIRKSEALNLAGIEISDGGMLLWGMNGRVEESLPDCLRILSESNLLSVSISGEQQGQASLGAAKRG